MYIHTVSSVHELFIILIESLTPTIAAPLCKCYAKDSKQSHSKGDHAL